MTRLLTARRLAGLVGAELADILMREWGGHRLPRLSAAQTARRVRDAQIRAAIDAGATYRQAGRDAGIDPAHAFRIANRVAEP